MNDMSIFCTPRQLYGDLVPARLELLGGGLHSRLEERRGGACVTHGGGGDIQA